MSEIMIEIIMEIIMGIIIEIIIVRCNMKLCSREHVKLATDLVRGSLSK